MTGRLAGLLLLMCVAVAGCGGDPTLAPSPCAAGSVSCGTPLPKEPTFTTLDLSPATADIEQGAEQPLNVVLRDQSGAQFFDNFYRIAYTSSDTSVATVSSGIVRGWGPGIATITVVVTSGAVSKSAVTTVRVRLGIPLDEVVLTAGKDGWQPSVAHVVAGGIVQWRAGPVDWSGQAVPTVWLYVRPDLSDYDSLDLRSGSLSFKFTTPGTYYYCSGSCWDRPDWGLIFVH